MVLKTIFRIYFMKLRYTILFVAVQFFGFSQQQFTVLKQDDKGAEIAFEQNLPAFSFVEIEGQQYIDFSKTHKHLLLESGNPALPVFGESFVLPNTGATHFEVLFDGYRDYPNVLVAPSKGNLKRNVDPALVPYTFGEAYQQNAFFPSGIVNPTEPFILRTVRGQVLNITPFQYNPVTKVLRVYENLRVKLVVDKNTVGINELASQQTNRADFKAVEQLFGNKPLEFDKYTSIAESGEILYLCADAYADSVKALMNWQFKKGNQVHLALKSEAGSTDTQIKSFISNFYATHPQLKYLVLVGDHEQIPTHSYGSSGWEQLYSDSYYGQLSGTDYYPELFVGRLSGSSTEIGVMVKRSLEYEINPKAGDWMTRAIGLASAEGVGIGDDGQVDFQHMREIRGQLLENGYTKVFEFYDGSQGQDDAPGNPASNLIKEAVNEGVGLFNYTGHGDVNLCVTGNFNTMQIDNATNNGMYPFVVSVACNNGTFVGNNCISEAWLRATENESPSGAIAACGSTILMSWAPPMETQDEMTNLITIASGSDKVYTLGALFYNAQLSMLEKYPGQGIEVMQTWVVFGDPSIQFRNKTTANLEVNATNCLTSVAITQVEVSCAQDGAMVALTQDGKLLGKAISSGGKAVVSVSNVDAGSDIAVTVTKPNYYPYQSSISTTGVCIPAQPEPEAAKLAIYPNPSNGTDISLEYIPTHKEVEIRIYDSAGKIVVEYVDSDELMSKKVIQLHTIRKGMYILQINDGGQIQTEKFMVY